MNQESILFELKEIECLVARKVINTGKKDNHFPITPIQAKIMKYLLEHREEKVYQRDLEEVLKVRRSTISGILRTMEKNSIIKRIPSSSDARIKQIVLTEEATKKDKEIKEKFKVLEEEILKDISKEELQLFFKVTKKLKDNLIERDD